MTNVRSVKSSGASQANIRDLAGRSLWDDVWSSRSPSRVSKLNFYHGLYARLFARLVRPGMRVLEAGCGGSIWLPFLATRLNAEVWGIDYSEAGMRLAEYNMLLVGASGRLILDDLFTTQALPKAGFDLIFSFGFIEHFGDSVAAVRRLAEFLAPLGRMLTMVPNLDGVVGLLHRLADREIYRSHLHFSPTALDAVHLNAGLAIESPAVYFGVFSLAVVNFSRLRRQLPPALDRSVWIGVRALQQAVVLPWRLLRWYPETRLFSPYVQGIYRPS